MTKSIGKCSSGHRLIDFPLAKYLDGKAFFGVNVLLWADSSFIQEYDKTDDKLKNADLFGLLRTDVC